MGTSGASDRLRPRLGAAGADVVVAGLGELLEAA